MPHTLDVRCPLCGELAFFEFAEIVRIREKKDILFFQENDQFDYLLCKDSCGHSWHAAVYYAGLHGRTVDTIRELPEGYDRLDWAHSKFLYRGSGLDSGSITCPSCCLHRRYELQWLHNAFFQIEFKRDLLWAFNLETAIELRDYIMSSNRDRSDYKWRSFLMKIPKKFLLQGARDTVSKRLKKIITQYQNGSNSSVVARANKDVGQLHSKRLSSSVVPHFKR